MIQDPYECFRQIDLMQPKLGRKAGCCLHIVLDDLNVESHHVRFCEDRAIEKKHPACQKLAELMLGLSEEERMEVADYYLKI